jgi:hypothetical protein
VQPIDTVAPAFSLDAVNLQGLDLVILDQRD